MKRFTLTLLVLALSMTVSAQNIFQRDAGDTLTLVSVQPIEDTNHRTLALSPDGEQIAWSDFGEDSEVLCVAPATSLAPSCTPFPENLVGVTQLYWSPGSRYIATHEDFFRMFDESDIWLFDTQENEFINLTDDGVEGGAIFRNDEPNTFFDYVPTWHPSGDLYFFSSIDDGENILMELYRLPAEDLTTAEPEFVTDLTTRLPEFSIFNTQNINLDGAVSFSPDGELLAVLARPTDQEEEAVWIYDLAADRWSRILGTENLQAVGLPEWAAEEARLFPYGVEWAANGLVISVLDSTFAFGITGLLYYVPLDTREVIPLNDFSTVASEADLFREDDEGNLPAYDMANFATFFAEENLVIYFNQDQGASQIGLSAFALPNAGDPIRLVMDQETDSRPAPNLHTGLGFNGETVRVLAGGYLFTFTYEG